MNKEKRWEDKYVKIIEDENEEIFLYKDKFPPVRLYKDGWGAVLYTANVYGEVQSYYNDENEYLEAIETLKELRK